MVAATKGIIVPYDMNKSTIKIGTDKHKERIPRFLRLITLSSEPHFLQTIESIFYRNITLPITCRPYIYRSCTTFHDKTARYLRSGAFAL